MLQENLFHDNDNLHHISGWTTRYIPMFQKELREAGLPEDLAYLAMIESGFNQRAYSKSTGGPTITSRADSGTPGQFMIGGNPYGLLNHHPIGFPIPALNLIISMFSLDFQ